MKGTKAVLFLTAGIAALAGLLFGYDTGVISGAILFIKDQFALSAVGVERVVSAVLLGAIIGAALSGSLADRFGRKKVLVVTAILFAGGAIGASMASGVAMIIAFRLVIGVAIGVASYTAPLYISEISPRQARGALVSLNQLMITCGIVASYLVDYALTTGNNQWRWMFGLGALPAIILLLGMIALSESPRWLVSRSRHDEARAILGRIMPTGEVDAELKTIRDSLTVKDGSWKEVMEPWVRPALVVGVVMAFFQQATGINTIIYYAPTIFEFAGFGSHKVSILATVGVGTVNVLMTIVAIWVIDKVGRKPLLYIGLVGMALSLGILGLAFHIPGMMESLKLATVLCIILYIASFAISLGPIFWLLISEIYPLRVRGRAMSLATLANWGFNMVVASTFLTLTEKLGKSGAFWLYGIICLAGILFCYLYVPETKGRSLESIEESLKKNRGLRALGSI